MRYIILLSIFLMGCTEKSPPSYSENAGQLVLTNPDDYLLELRYGKGSDYWKKEAKKRGETVCLEWDSPLTLKEIDCEEK